MPNTPASMKRSHFALFQKIYPFFLLVSSPSGLLTGLAWWIQQPVFSQPPSVRIYLLFVYKPIITSTGNCACEPSIAGCHRFSLNLSLDAICIEAKHPGANNKKKEVNFVLRNFQVRLRREIRAKCSYRKGNLSIDDGFLLWKCIWDLNLLAKEMNAWLVTSRVA